MSDFGQPGAGEGEMCAGCGARIWQDGLSCGNCGNLRFDRSGTLELAPRMRRLAAYLIDSIGLAIVLAVLVLVLGEQVENDDGSAEFVLARTDELVISVAMLGTAVLGWLFTAGRGQSPGMRMLGLYVYRVGGGTASAARVIVRDHWPSGLGLIFTVISLVVGDSVQGVTSTAATAVGIAFIVNVAWVLWQRDRRALHDFIFDTVVVRQRQLVLGVPTGGSQHGHPSPPGELPPDR